MQEYKIISALSKWGMAKKARQLMNYGNGWKPCGGVSKSWGIYYQAFTK